MPPSDKPLDNINHSWAVGATVGQVSQEDKPSFFWMATIIRIPKLIEQVPKGINLTMDIAHDVEWPVK